MRVRVIGSAGSMPGPASPASSYLVEADLDGRTWRVVMDMGSGAFGALQRYCDPRSVDAVALSHLHPDHCADLTAMHVYLEYHPEGPADVLPVLGPFGTASRIAQLRGEDSAGPKFDIRVWQVGVPMEIGPFTITAEAARHPIPAYCICIAGPREEGSGKAVVAYSGDTDECEGVVAAAQAADLFLCEATYQDHFDVERGVHLTAKAAGQAATQAGAKSLVLTHIPPWFDPNDHVSEARGAYEGDISVATPGDLYVL